MPHSVSFRGCARGNRHVEVEADPDQADGEARQAGSQRRDPAMQADLEAYHRDRSADQGRDGIEAARKTVGTRPISTSRIVPPPTAVTAPRMTAGRSPSRASMALVAPVMANRLRPTRRVPRSG